MNAYTRLKANKNIKVLYVSYGLGIYGANTSLLNMICILRKKYEIEPTVLIRAKREFAAKLDELRIPYICMPWNSWVWQKGAPWKTVIKKIVRWNGVCYRNILFTIRKNRWKFDLVHTNTSIVNIGAYIAKELDIPHVWHLREFVREDYDLLFNRGSYLAGRYMQKHSDMLIANSRAVKEKFSNFIDSRKIKVIYNIFNLKKNIYQRDFSRLSRKKRVDFLFTGLIHRNKNQIEALRAANLLKNTMNIHCFKIYFAGDGNEKYFAKLRKYTKKRGLESHVEFLGYVPNLHKFREKMDVALVCSKMEGFGRVTVEAMLSQMPVIGTNKGGTPEIIDHNRTGYLYELGSADQLASYMKNLIENRNLIKVFGLNGYEKAKKRYAAEINAKKIYSLYLDVSKKYDTQCSMVENNKKANK